LYFYKGKTGLKKSKETKHYDVVVIEMLW